MPPLLDERLTLLGQSPEDLPAISALVQDATLRRQDIAYDARSRRLVLLVNRYRHEAGTPSRVRTALRLETVETVQRQNWPAGETVLALLSLARDGDWLHLTFAGNTALRARVEVIEVVLEDLSAPWPASREPHHA
jgi:Protein of unknown function (DUF2948)